MEIRGFPWIMMRPRRDEGDDDEVDDDKVDGDQNDDKHDRGEDEVNGET